MKDFPNDVLVQSVKLKDQEAMGVLYNRLKDPFIKSFRFRSDALGINVMDLYHDVFLKWHDLLMSDKYDIGQSDKLKQWMFVVAKSMLNKRYRHISGENPLQEFIRRLDLADDLDQKMASEDLINFLKKKIDEMKATCKNLLRLFFFDNKNWKEISELMPTSGIDTIDKFRVNKWRCINRLILSLQPQIK